MEVHGVAQRIWPQSKVDSLGSAGVRMEQLLARALQEIVDGLLSKAILEVRLGCIFLYDRIYFLDPKNRSCQDSSGFLRISFFSGGIFHRNHLLEGVAGIPVFC